MDILCSSNRVGCVCRSVLWSSEAVWDADKTPAWFYLPETCPAEKSSPVHHHPAQLPGASLGHQNLQSRHSLSYDGKTCVFVDICVCVHDHQDLIWCLCVFLQVLALVFIRKLLDFVFSKRDLSWLDDLMPESKKKKMEDAQQEVPPPPITHCYWLRPVTTLLAVNDQSLKTLFYHEHVLSLNFRRISVF